MVEIHDCECALPPTSAFRGVLRHTVEGTGLSLCCATCGGWIEDSWLFSDGIPVEVAAESSRDITGEWHTTYTLTKTAW